jgi:hypothetical protein
MINEQQIRPSTTHSLNVADHPDVVAANTTSQMDVRPFGQGF